MDDLLSEFLTETTESLQTLDLELVNLEQNPNDKAILSNIFRLVHTIKGTCGFLGLPRLEKLAHSAENVLGKFRDGELEVTPAAVTLILNSIDRIKESLAHIEAHEVEPEGDDLDLIEQLDAMADGKTAAPPKLDAPPMTAEAADEPADGSSPAASSGPKLDARGFPVAAELLDEVEAAMSSGKTAASDEEMLAEMAAERETDGGDQAADEAKTAAVATPPVPAARPPAKVAPADVPADDAKKRDSLATQSIRVNVDLLENLMTLVSELVLTRNQLLQMVRGSDDSEFAAPLQRLSHITSDLQEGVMKTRMQPIGNAWAKLPRIVRDLSIEMNKKIDLQMLGAETELDRQVLELIKDPLTHMVRNSADHGLENSEERIAVGKPEIGNIVLNAYHEGGHIIIEIKDDGRGLNIEKIAEKALRDGIVTEIELEAMSDNQIAQMIFRAGLSTAEKVTAVSGRGVGMDVVKTNIEKIGGTVELKTERGRGSTFVIKIPLTLAIVSALIVRAGRERFAIPQISVLELVRVTDKSEQTIERINNAPVLRLRNRLLPLVSLSDLLRLDDGTTLEDVDAAARDADSGVDTDAAGETSTEQAAPVADSGRAVTRSERKETFIIVLQVGTYNFGLIVDRVFDTEEIVVKPVAPILRDITMFSGNTILGDGSVIMILDPNGIAQATGESSISSGQMSEMAAHQGPHHDDTTSMLIFRAKGDDLKAVPLGLVARLEEIDLASVEHSYGTPVVQYRGQLMPLVCMDETCSLGTEGRQPVLVFQDRDRSMGLAVDEIVDIVEDRLKVELSAKVPGVIGTAVIDGKATDVIDTGYFLTRAFGDWFGGADRGGSEDDGGSRILLVDDSAFFRNLLTPLLSAAGYSCTAVDGPAAAFRLRDQGVVFDAIVSDIEMPDMDGFAFAEKVRASGIWQRTPMIALSSHATEQDMARGREVGFDDYVAKFDRDSLIQALRELVDTRSSFAAGRIEAPS